MFLCLFTGGAPTSLPKALGVGADEGDRASFIGTRRSLKRKGRDRVPIKSREWILEKKERAKRQGMTYVKLNSKYTGRKRKPRF
jgi:18S rRNA (guanine1575-N7)-methyltransferase